MPFYSVLFPGPDRPLPGESGWGPPDSIHDLALDQIVDAIAAGWEEYDLGPFFCTSLDSIDAIPYRQEIVQDLEDEVLMQAVQAFSRGMRTMRKRLERARRLYYKYEKAREFLRAVEVYCDAVGRLVLDLRALHPASRGMLEFRRYLAEYAGRAYFDGLVTQTSKLKSDLPAIRYCLLLKGRGITVRPYNAEVDYSAVVEATFDRFRAGAPVDYRAAFPPQESMSHVEAQVLDRIALLHPETFNALDAFCAEHADYVDKTIADFEREIQFYVAYLTFVGRMRGAGLRFCYPRLSDQSKELCSRGAFDLALALTLAREAMPIVCNDFFLQGPERILVVSGPNQSGKTTFARMFGQLHYLASPGRPVPGTEARLFHADRVFTHFEKREEIKNLRGKLHDDLIRIRRILDPAPPGASLS